MSWTYDSWRNQASPSITTWTDTLVPDVTEIRAIHVTELRTALEKEVTDRGLSSPIWTDPGLAADITYLKAPHVNEPRAYSEQAYQAPCNTDAAVAPIWTDQEATPAMGNRVVGDVTEFRDDHINELRTYINHLQNQCLCDCNAYCCNCNGHCGCNCNGHCGCEDHWVW